MVLTVNVFSGLFMALCHAEMAKLMVLPQRGVNFGGFGKRRNYFHRAFIFSHVDEEAGTHNVTYISHVNHEEGTHNVTYMLHISNEEGTHNVTYMLHILNEEGTHNVTYISVYMKVRR